MAEDGKVIYKIEGDNSGFAQDIGESKSIASKAFSGIGSAAASMGKATLAGLGAAAAGIAALGKKSLDAYGDYEQLVGGVETLFKESAGIVEEYAANAYQTAGMSANEYMETVTGFSASLLQSLGNDTEAAAEKANLALVDMSDNANKMGTDVTMIQNAYQGFAKQNYTMLDNLKLGYGGTKQEMERLLADAEKLTGVHYDLSSYADIVDAIHAVQTEMGITGTTAEEASSTIQGSISAAGAAWENLLTGLSDENADIGALVQNLIESVGTVLDNVIPKIGVILDSVVTLISELLPKLINEIAAVLPELLPKLLDGAKAIVQALVDALPEILNLIMGILPDVVQIVADIILAIVKALPDMIQCLLDVLPEILQIICETLIEAIPVLVDAAVQIVVGLANFIADNIDYMIDAAIEIIMALVNALLDPDNLEKLINAAVKLVVAIAKAIITHIPEILEAVVQIIIAVVGAIINAAGDLIKAVGEVIGSIVNAIGGFIGDMINAGKNLIAGFLKGIVDGIKNIIGTVQDAFGEVVDGIKNFLGIRSPSKVAFEIGAYFDKGAALGIDAFSGLPKKAAHEMAVDIVAGAVPDIGNLQGEIMEGMTISPSSGQAEQIGGAVADAVTGQNVNVTVGIRDGDGLSRYLTAQVDRGNAIRSKNLVTEG